MAYRAAIAVALVAPILGLAACDPVSQVNARGFYLDYCAACHGDAGKGDGPLATGLDTLPADLTTIARRNGGSFDFAAVMAQIDGYKAPDRAMPRFSDMLAEAEKIPFDSGDDILTPTPIPLVALAEYVRSIQEP